MKKYAYDYFQLHIPLDIGDLHDRLSLAVLIAEQRTRVFALPVEWEAKPGEGDLVLVRRKRLRSGKQHRIRESQADYQLPLIDMTDPKPAGRTARRRDVEKCLRDLRRIQEELNQQLYSHPTERPLIQSPAAAGEILMPFLSFLDHEQLWVLVLDTRNRVKSLVTVYKGSVNSSQVRIAEIFQQAIIEKSPAIIVAHNHPSGDPTPSPDDVAVTRGIVQAGKLLDIEVLDHIVIAADRFVSLKERGLGFST